MVNLFIIGRTDTSDSKKRSNNVKKLIFTLGVMLLICVCAVATTIEIETPPLKYVINGEVVKMPKGESGFLYNDRTYVPIRFIAEALNKDVSWNDDTNTITISDKQPDCYELTDGVLYKSFAVLSISSSKIFLSSGFLCILLSESF